MSTPFNFNKYEIEKIVYKKLAQGSHETPKNEINIQLFEDESSKNIKLTISVEFEAKSKEVEIILSGYFEWLLDEKVPEFENIMVRNGTQILFPYLRSIVSSISVMDGGDPIILPTINPFDLSRIRDNENL